MSLLMSINISSETGHHGKHSQMSPNGLGHCLSVTRETLGQRWIHELMMETITNRELFLPLCS